jgi:hypothetical protein
MYGLLPAPVVNTEKTNNVMTVFDWVVNMLMLIMPMTILPWRYARGMCATSAVKLVGPKPVAV